MRGAPGLAAARFRLDVVVADAVTGGSLCESLPGRPFDLDRHEDDDGQPTTPAGQAVALAVPGYMAELVDRAAMLMIARGVFTVDFTWWRGGEDRHYIGRLEWVNLTVRVVVHNNTTGDFVCRSLPAEMFTLDSAEGAYVGEMPGADEVARFEHEQR